MENTGDKSPRDSYGETPLHGAARNGHLAVCKYIIKITRDKSPKSNSGETPIDVAWNHRKVVNFIQNNNFEPKSRKRKVKN